MMVRCTALLHLPIPTRDAHSNPETDAFFSRFKIKYNILLKQVTLKVINQHVSVHETVPCKNINQFHAWKTAGKFYGASGSS